MRSDRAGYRSTETLAGVQSKGVIRTHKCLDCPAQLTTPNAKRCHSCAHTVNVERQRQAAAKRTLAKRAVRRARLELLISELEVVDPNKIISLDPETRAEIIAQLKILKHKGFGPDEPTD